MAKSKDPLAATRFNPNKVRCLGNLTQVTDKQKAAMRRANGVKARWSLDTVQPQGVKYRDDFLMPIKRDYVPPRRKRGSSGCVMSPEKRAMVAARLAAREAFFRSI